MNVNKETNRNDITDELIKIQDGISYITGESNVSISKLMTNKFISENTEFNSLGELFKAAGIKSDNDLKQENFNAFIQKHTSFMDWEEMLIQSSNKYISDNS